MLFLPYLYNTATKQHSRIKYTHTLVMYLIFVCLSPVSQAEVGITIALLSNQNNQFNQQYDPLFKEEIEKLTGEEFAISWKPIKPGSSKQNILDSLQQAYDDPEVSLVLVMDKAANQILVSIKNFVKPTFLPLLIDQKITQAPYAGNTSGTENLNYLSDSVSFKDDLASFNEIADIKRTGMIIDPEIFLGIPDIEKNTVALASDLNIDLKIITSGSNRTELRKRIQDAKLDSIILGGLDNYNAKQAQELISDINALKLPSYSVLGDRLVELGVLASDSQVSRWQHVARLNALNIQSVLIGERAQDQIVEYSGKRQLTINMNTARKIGISPRYDVLVRANLLGSFLDTGDISYTFPQVAELALTHNLDLLTQQLATQAQRFRIDEANAAWLPQLSLSSRLQKRKATSFGGLGRLADNSADTTLQLSQLIYSDPADANRRIESYLYKGEQFANEEVRLDIVRAATTNYINVLRNQVLLKVQQDNYRLTQSNLDLAENRVSVGSASAADVYRWQSQKANDQANLINTFAELQQSREALNRIINRPLDEGFKLTDISLNTSVPFQTRAYNQIVDSPRKAQLATEFIVKQGLKISPELGRLRQQLAAKKRELKSKQRSRWLPEFSISGNYNVNHNESDEGVSALTNQDDWNIGIDATLPLSTGGRLNAEIRRNKKEIHSLERGLAAASQDIEQSIRAEKHRVDAAFFNIALRKTAAESADKNLALVTDAYSKGLVRVLDLLDAQEANLRSNQTAENAVYDFLLQLIAMQRAAGYYNFLLTPQQQQQLIEEFGEVIRNEDSESPKENAF